MTHPSSLNLEAFACGEPSTSVGDHLAACTECSAFVERVRGALSAGPSRSRSAELVAKAAAMNEAAPKSPSAVVSSTPAERAAQRRWGLVKAASVAIPLAAAAALLFFLRSPNAPEPTAHAPATSEPLALGPASSDPETTFKGGVQVAVVRERDGKQARFSGRVAVKPGDRLRVEVALDREQAILAAVLGEDASWVELMPEGVRLPGTHFSDRSARVDSSPLRGTILVGSPAAMKRAKETKDVSGLTSVRIDWEAP